VSSPEEGILKKWIAVGMVAAFAACSNGTVTGPTQTEEIVAVAPAPAATLVPTPTPEVRVQFWEGGILPNAGWDVKNIGPQTESWTAYYTSFDNQSLALGSQQTTINRGDSFRGSFNKTCVQVDVTQGGPGDTPFLAGFIDHNGKVVRANQIDREACKPVVRVPDPEPTPLPSPSPTPTPTPSPSPTPTPGPSPSPTPAPQYCYYEISGKPEDKSEKCAAEQGQWSSWYNEQNHDHEQCRLTYPGIAKKSFNLNSGQSAVGCLKKQND